MRTVSIAVRLIRLLTVFAATAVITRPALALNANACANCETASQCKSGLLTGFAGCQVSGDRCTVNSSTCGSS